MFFFYFVKQFLPYKSYYPTISNGCNHVGTNLPDYTADDAATDRMPFFLYNLMIFLWQ